MKLQMDTSFGKITNRYIDFSDVNQVAKKLSDERGQLVCVHLSDEKYIYIAKKTNNYKGYGKSGWLTGQTVMVGEFLKRSNRPGSPYGILLDHGVALLKAVVMFDRPYWVSVRALQFRDGSMILRNV